MGKFLNEVGWLTGAVAEHRQTTERQRDRRRNKRTDRRMDRRTDRRGTDGHTERKLRLIDKKTGIKNAIG